MKRKGKMFRRIAGCLLAALLLSENSLGVAEAVGKVQVVAAGSGAENVDAVPEDGGALQDEGLDYVLGRPLTAEEDAEERRAMEEYASRLVPFDPGPEAPRLDKNNGLIVRSAELPAAYDAREHGLITPVRNQYPYGICWSFTSIQLAEASMVKKNLLPLAQTDLSEYHLAYYTYRFVTDPLGGTDGDNNYKSDINSILNGGSNIGRAKNTLIGWMGAVPEDVAEFTSTPVELPMTKEDAYDHNVGILKNVMEININDRNAAKQAIMDYGSLGIMYYSHTSPVYYNTSTHAQYINDSSLGVNHAVSIVGWNDAYSKANFNTQPSKDGAWLIRNSWGPSHGIEGYFWLSYEDATIYPTVYAFEMEDAAAYDNNYQYDGAGVDDADSYTAMNRLEVANVFTAAANPGKWEILKAVSFDIDTANVDYSIQIYKNLTNLSNPTSGTAVITPQTGTTSHAGYYTIDLDEEVLLEQGDTFSVVIAFTKNGSAIQMVSEYETDGATAFIGEGQSFLKSYSSWADAKDYEFMGYYNLRIKAFTVNEDEVSTIKPVTGIRMEETAGTVKVGETKQLAAAVIPNDATNQKIIWDSSEPRVATVDGNGLVTGKSQGSARITATTEDGGHRAAYDLTVEADPVITSVEASQISANQAVVTVEANDGSGFEIAAYRLRMTAGEGSPVITEGEARNVFLISGLSPVTAYTFMAEAEDSAGNTVEQAVSFTTPKEVGPAAPVVTGSYEASQTDESTYTYTVNEIAGAEYKMDGGAWQDSNVFGGILPGSTHTFYARMKETASAEAGEAGSTGSVEFPEIAAPDTEPPVLEVTMPGGDGWYNTPQSLEIRVEDSGSGIRSISYQVDDGDIIPLFTEGDSVAGQWSNEASPIETVEGDHTYTILAIDREGHEIRRTVRIKQDTVAPVLSGAEAPAGDNLGETFANISFSADDSGSFYYKLQDGSSIPAVEVLMNENANAMTAGHGNNISLSGLQPDTAYTLYIVAKDKAENISEEIVSISFRTRKITAGPDPDPSTDPSTDPTPDPGPDPIPDPVVGTVAAPSFHAEAGTYPADQEVAISSATEGAEIYYTTDGTEPDVSDTRYTKAIKVNRRMTIKAVAVKDGMKNSEVVTAAYVIERPFPFTDVTQDGKWKHQSVKYVWDNSIMNGISGTTLFQPDSPLTRAMFATVLYRMAGEPAVEFTEKFSDVKAGQWYSDAIIWANQKGIVDGLGDGSYGIGNNITREQIAKMLYEYARVRGYDNTAKKALSDFTDEKEVSGWAVEYMQWATAVEMITGKPNAGSQTYRMDPKGEATRAECAAMLMRFENKYIP